MNKSQIGLNKVDPTRLSGYQKNTKMKFGRILSNLVNRKVTEMNLMYEKKVSPFLRNLESIPNLSELKIGPILLITDINPRSLISIAYALKLTSSFGEGTKLYVLTERKHSEIIQSECKQNNILLVDLIEKRTISLEDISKIIKENGIRMMIISDEHPLLVSVIKQIPISVFISSFRI